MRYTPPVYKLWLHRSNSSSSSLVASGMEIGLQPGTTTPQSPPQNSNKALSRIPVYQATNLNGLEDAGTGEPQVQLAAKSSFPIRNLPLERVKDIPPPPPLQFWTNTRRRNTLPTGSPHKIWQLTGVDLNIGDKLPLGDEDDDDDNDSLWISDSSKKSTSSGSMYSQPGGDYDTENSGYMSQRSLGPRSSGTLLQSSTYQTPKQMQMNRQRPRALRHTDRPNTPQNVRTLRIVRPHNVADVNVLRDIVFQEQQRHNLGYNADYSQEGKHTLASPFIAELEDTDIGLMPRPLKIRTKKTQNQPLSKSSLFQSAADSWSYGINELTSSSTINYNVSESSRPSSRNTRGSTPVSPMGSMESDHIILPPIPDTQPKSGQRFERQFGSGKHPLRSPFPFNSTTYEELDLVPSPTGHKPTRRLSGKLMGWSGTKSPVRSKARRADGPDTPVASKSVFTGLNVLQKRNGHFQEMVEKARGRALKKSAEERRRESLKGKIVIVGVPDQSPDGRVSEWL